jgi:hypothetical protein
MIARATADWYSPQGRLTAFHSGTATFWREGRSTDVTIMIGDSNMEQYFARVERLLNEKKAEASIVFAVSGGCAPILNVLERHHPDCSNFVKSALEFAGHERAVRKVVIGAQWFSYFSAESTYEFFGGNRLLPLSGPAGSEKAFGTLEDELRQLRSIDKEVYLILNIPIGPDFDPKLRIRRSVWGMTSVLPAAVAKEADLLTKYGATRERLLHVARDAGATAIDPLNHLCHDGVCPSAQENGDPLFTDGYHLRASFVRDHASYIDQIFGLASE